MIGLEHVMTHPPDVVEQTAPRAHFSAIHDGSLTGGRLPPRTIHHTRVCVWLALGQQCVTPRQSCPLPNGFGRNLRSKTRCSQNYAIHTKYHISLRSSSMQESRYPLPSIIVFSNDVFSRDIPRTSTVYGLMAAACEL
ncbi:hypothetical protein SESBI_17055 [Sesbania bispinosa]|nr:hypothetical protein SESBI_17055 [Sesbania bispinosa]